MESFVFSRRAPKAKAAVALKEKATVDRSSAEKNEEIQNLRSQRAFLSLPPITDQTIGFETADTTIVVLGRTDEPVHAHRFILSSKSRVFRSMFSSRMMEEGTGIIHIDDATLPVIRATIHFCYNAEIHFTDKVTAEEVLKVAHKYQIGLLVKICDKHLTDTLAKLNVAKRLRLAKKFSASGLKAAAIRYFKGHFDEVIEDVLEEIY